MKNTFILMIVLYLSPFISAQTTPTRCNCCTAEYKQFDFWLGEWEVFNRTGVKVGENKIITMQDSCLIQENWMSVGQTGTSYNFYNPNDSTWNQTYIDNAGTVLQLKGGFIDNKMILKSESIKSKKANFYYYNEITWAKDSLGDVSQKWEVINDQGVVLQVAFDGVYKRKINSATKKETK